MTGGVGAGIRFHSCYFVRLAMNSLILAGRWEVSTRYRLMGGGSPWESISSAVLHSDWETIENIEFRQVVYGESLKCEGLGVFYSLSEVVER
jgi:hypothetical protein